MCVVGLGGSGLAALSELVRRGVPAVGIDETGVAAGAAGSNGGFLLAGLAAFHHEAVGRFGRSRALACYRATVAALTEMATETPAAVRRTGSLRIAVDAAELDDCDRQADAMISDGLAVERYSGPEGDGLLVPDDASLQPVERCRELAQRCLEAGARLFGAAQVLEISPGRVRCGSGGVECRSVLVCVDGRLEQLLPSLEGVVRSARLQMLATEPLGRIVAERPVYRRYGYDYYQQVPTGELLLGGARDLGGEGEWTTKAHPGPVVQSVLERLAEQLGGPARVSHRWAGVVGFTASGLPVVREVDDGVFAAGGYCGTGNLIGRIAGRALVELALDGSSEMAELFDAPEAR